MVLVLIHARMHISQIVQPLNVKVVLQTVIFAQAPIFVDLVRHHMYLIMMVHVLLNLLHFVQLVYTNLMDIASVYAHQDIGLINYLKSVSNVLKIALNVLT